MQCLVTSFEQVLNRTGITPFQKKTAWSGVALLITGITLATIGLITTILAITGVLPSGIIFLCPSLAVIGLILISLSTGIMAKRHRALSASKIKEMKHFLNRCSESHIEIYNAANQIGMQRFTQLTKIISDLIEKAKSVDQDFLNGVLPLDEALGLLKKIHLELTSFETAMNNDSTSLTNDRCPISWSSGT